MEARIQAEAAKRSLPVEDYLLQLVRTAVPAEDEAERRIRSLALLDSLDEVGTAEEQRETFDALKAAIDEDRLSARARFS